MFAKGQMGNLMRQAQKMNEKMQEFQATLGDLEAQGEAAAGMVKITVNGNKEIKSVSVSDDAMDDKEMLEDLIAAAFNNALSNIDEQIQEKTAEATSKLGLPPGMQLPF
jgi:DNA-binding YbaB/EbfC family protein